MIPKELQNMKPLHGDEPLPRDSEYLGADDIETDKEPVLTIKNIYRGKVTLSRGKEVKNVLTFVEESVPGIIGEVRPMILNSTNRQTLKGLFKHVTANALEGKKIQLYIEHGVRNPANGEGAAKYVAPKCEECGKEIKGLSNFTAEQIAAGSKQKYGKCLCVECGKKAKEALEQTNAAPAENNDSLASQILADATEGE